MNYETFSKAHENLIAQRNITYLEKSIKDLKTIKEKGISSIQICSSYDLRVSLDLKLSDNISLGSIAVNHIENLINELNKEIEKVKESLKKEFETL